MPNCFDKQAARHTYTHTHHVANLFRNIYTPTFSSSICVCSLSCILINHSPLYIHHTPAHTHSLCHSILSSSIQLAIVSTGIDIYIHKRGQICVVGGKPEATAINNIELSSFLCSLIDYLD
jgi:hypothetical protein